MPCTKQSGAESSATEISDTETSALLLSNVQGLRTNVRTVISSAEWLRSFRTYSIFEAGFEQRFRMRSGFEAMLNCAFESTVLAKQARAVILNAQVAPKHA